MARPSKGDDKCLPYSTQLEPLVKARLDRLAIHLGMPASALARTCIKHGITRYESEYNLPPMPALPCVGATKPGVGASVVEEVYDITDL